MYYSGASALPVKPVTRRVTFTRGQPPKNEKKYLQRAGRMPLNRRGYPVASVPVAVRPMMPLSPFGLPRSMTRKRGRSNLGTPIDLDLSREPGQFQLGYMTDTDMSLEPGRQLGQSILTPIVPFKTTYTPAVPSVVTTSVPAPSSFWNPFAAVVNLWNERPQVLKDIKIKVNPNTVMRAAQSVVKPGQVEKFVDQAAQWGVNLDYRGMPISGQTAGFGYQLAGINWQQYLPWIIGGGALLFVVPMLMKKR